jgi:hypothetical protein
VTDQANVSDQLRLNRHELLLSSLNPDIPPRAGRLA